MKPLALILLTLVLAACGGGSDSSGSSSVIGSDSYAVTRSTTTGLNTVNVLAVGDLNNDGREDVVVGGWGSPNGGLSRIYVFYQTEQGTLVERTTEVLPSNTYTGSQKVFIADFDNDGRNDIFLPGFDDTCAPCFANSVVYWNTGTTFVRQDLNDQVEAHGACVSDIDRDGDIDLLISGVNGGLYVNQGNRNFAIQRLTLPNDYFATCSVVHNQNNTISIIMGQSGLVTGYKSSILTMDSGFNVITNVAIAAPRNSSNVEFDLINSLVLDVNDDGIPDFVAIYNDLLPGVPGAKQVFIADGLGSFIPQVPFDTQYNNAYYSHALTINGKETVLFGADNGHTTLYQNVNGVFVSYRQSWLINMIQSHGAAVNNWTAGAATFYQNTNTGKVFVLQYLQGKYYTKELL